MSEEIDLGDGHYLTFFQWAPDRELNPQYKDLPDVPKAGALIRHSRSDNGDECNSGINFDLPAMRQVFPNDSRWQVENWEPLTLSPSILCLRCGDHGFIRDGKWVKA